MASGVAAESEKPDCPLDRLVVVSGTKIGWHGYGEDSERINQKEKDGELNFVRVLD